MQTMSMAPSLFSRCHGYSFKSKLLSSQPGRNPPAGIRAPVLDQRQDAQRAAAALLDLERRADQERAGRRQQVEVGEALQAVAAGAVHVVVARVRRPQVNALAGVGADRLGAEAEHVALLDEEAHRLDGRARRVLALLVEVLVCLGVAGALRPVGAHQHPRSGADRPCAASKRSMSATVIR